MKRFMDDVSVLVVEMHLMKRLPELFSPDVVCGLDDYKISSLVGESAETTEHRIMLNKKLTTLQECEAKLDRVRRGVVSIDDSPTSF